MEWQVRYEPITRKKPWSVYVMRGAEPPAYQKGFTTEEEAKLWLERQGGIELSTKKLDEVEKASLDSFPASDAPAWTETSAKGRKTR